DYEVDDAEGDNTEDFGDHIQVTFLYNADKMDEVIYETSLSELRDMEPEAVSEEVFNEILGEGGLELVMKMILSSNSNSSRMERIKNNSKVINSSLNGHSTHFKKMAKKSNRMGWV